MGLGYEQCICIHAEQDAIAESARNGISVDGATAFVTLRPCLTCVVLMMHAGVKAIYYDQDWSYEDELEEVYRRIVLRLETFERLAIAPARP